MLSKTLRLQLSFTIALAGVKACVGAVQLSCRNLAFLALAGVGHAWRDAEAATTLGTVYLGDKKKGVQHYSHFCASYVPDIIKIPDGEGSLPELDEVKNLSLIHI